MTLDYLGDVVGELSELARLFGEADHRLFLVGGVVRELWLGAPLGPDSDIDLTTDAVPDQIKSIVGPIADAIWTQGERFGTIGCLINGRDIEITTHRSEAYESGSRKPIVKFATEIDADLSRRDFTVNAMAIELPDGSLVDPFGGANDLGVGTLRTPMGPELSFTDDPLRMLRAARFSAGYDLIPTDELVEAMTDLAPRLDIVAVERIVDEFDKLLAVENPGDAFLLLQSTGLLERLFPNLHVGLASGDHGPLVVLARIPPSDLVLRWTVLGWFDGATDRGAGVGFGRRLRLSGERTSAISRIISYLADLRSLAGGPLADLRRWAYGAGENRDQLLLLGGLLDHDVTHSVRGRLDELAKSEDLDDVGVPIDGSRVMELCDVEPGPRVGELLALLADLRFEQGPLTVAQAEAALPSKP